MTEVLAPYTCPDCGGTNGECVSPECRHVPGDGKETEFVGKLSPNWHCRHWNGKRRKYCKSRAGSKTSHPGVGRCNMGGGNVALKHGQRTGDPGRYANIQHERLRDKLERFEADPAPLNIVAELNLGRALLEDFIERHEEFSTALLAWFESFKASGRQMASDDIELLNWIIEEFEAIALEQYQNGDGERAQQKVERIRTIVSRLGTPIDEGRPRRMVDIADARQLIETVIRTVESIQKHDEATHISRANFFRFLEEIGRTTNTVLEKHLAPDVAEVVGKEIADRWLGVRLPA